MTPENGPKSFGTFEKRAPGLPIDTMRSRLSSHRCERERVEENMNVNFRHHEDVYDAHCRGDARPHNVGDLVWLEVKAVPMWMCQKFHYPW